MKMHADLWDQSSLACVVYLACQGLASGLCTQKKAVEDARDGLRPGEAFYYADEFLYQLASNLACAVEPARATGDDFNAHAADPPVRFGCGQLYAVN